MTGMALMRVGYRQCERSSTKRDSGSPRIATSVDVRFSFGYPRVVAPARSFTSTDDVLRGRRARAGSVASGQTVRSGADDPGRKGRGCGGPLIMQSRAFGIHSHCPPSERSTAATRQRVAPGSHELYAARASGRRAVLSLHPRGRGGLDRRGVPGLDRNRALHGRRRRGRRIRCADPGQTGAGVDGGWRDQGGGKDASDICKPEGFWRSGRGRGQRSGPPPLERMPGIGPAPRAAVAVQPAQVGELRGAPELATGSSAITARARRGARRRGGPRARVRDRRGAECRYPEKRSRRIRPTSSSASRCCGT